MLFGICSALQSQATTEDNRLANSCLESTLASSSSENKKRKALSVCKSYTVLYNQATFFRQKYEDAYNRRYSTQLRGLNTLHIYITYLMSYILKQHS